MMRAHRARSNTGFIARRGASAAALAAGLLFAPAFAAAQVQEQPVAVGEDVADTPVSAEPVATEGASIIVTGSRIARTGFTTPTPVTFVGDEQIARQGASNIAQVLNEIPAFRAQSSPTTAGVFVSNLGASTADLRGLGGNRTLVLIDTRRVVASTVAGGSFTPANTVDLNLVPSSLLQRAEVVTGGASSAYGSDAVAGVTNLIINRDLQGLRGTFQYGQTEEGDAEEFLISYAYGTGFGGGRGRFIAGAEYVDNSGTGDCYTRDWCAESYNTISNPFRTGSTTERVFAGEAATIIVPNVRTATASNNGLVVLGPLRGLSFRPDGTTFQHDFGRFSGSGLFQSGGGDPRLAFYEHFPIAARSERINAFSAIDYEVADGLRLFAEGSFGHVNGSMAGSARRDVAPPGSYQIRRDNAFLPAEVGAQMDALGLATLPFGRIWNDIGPQIGTLSRETYRAVGGFDWQFGNGLNLDAYYQYGQTDYSQRGYNTTINNRMGFAIDAVRAPDGRIVCRAALAGNPAAAGCVPLNPFGEGAGSQAAYDYVTGTVMQDTTLRQHVGALTLRGNLLDLWAGPLAFAGGVEYREDSVASVIDPISAANNFFTSPGGGILGGRQSVNVKEGFLEMVLPLASGLAFADSAEINGAVRITDYSTSGQVETWKIGADWSPLSWIRFRGTRSRDIRAPNVFELYALPQSSFQNVLDPQTGSQYLVPTLLSGNDALVPEIANTWTAGVILSPQVGPSPLRLSVDWYDINLEGAISTLGAQVIVNRCFEGATDICGLIDRDAGGAITAITNPNLNLNTLITRGWDVEAQYALPLSALGAASDARLNFRVLATFVRDLITVDSSGRAVNRAGMNGSAVSAPSGLPDYTINAFLGYEGDRFSTQVQVRHISGGIYNAELIGPHQAGYDPLLPNSVSDNKVEAVTYVNLNAQYALWSEGAQRVELFGVVNNLFDKDPPKDLPSSFGPTNNVLYDVLGRSYRVGVRFAF